MDYGVITFTSTYGAIYAQKVLRPAADVLTMPVLREISLGCGIAVRFQPEDLEAVRAALAASTLKPDEYAFYGVTGSGDTLRAERLKNCLPAAQNSSPLDISPIFKQALAKTPPRPPVQFGGTAPMAAPSFPPFLWEEMGAPAASEAPGALPIKIQRSHLQKSGAPPGVPRQITAGASPRPTGSPADRGTGG